ncbi:MAG TPA: response regulator transcription factor, partial [Alphaproteobacteria bacterium]|nr:response regulator transcription factor [Alphaproteobacteria bacterium]
PLARAGLRAALEEAGCTVVGLAGDGGDVAADAALYRAGVVVWDLGWDPGDGVEALAGVDALGDEGMPVIVLVPDEAHAPAAWAAGARGVLMRDAAGAALAAAAGAVVQGLAVMDPALAPGARIERESGGQALEEALTSRETEVLQLLADGLTNRAIGQALGISEHTVKFHVNAVLGKLGAQSRTEAVVRAMRLGLILL